MKQFGWDHIKEGFLNDIYNDDQAEKRNIMGEVENRGVEKGVQVH